jgi:hypothetical protein
MYSGLIWVLLFNTGNMINHWPHNGQWLIIAVVFMLNMVQIFACLYARNNIFSNLTFLGGAMKDKTGGYDFRPYWIVASGKKRILDKASKAVQVMPPPPDM